jgi:hypothetical protein
MTPTITLNGTDPKVLFSDLQDLRRQVENALKSLEKVWPNKCDYVGEDQKYFAARNEVGDWQEELGRIQEGVTKTLEYLSDFLPSGTS